jgi:hypothetical protein
MASFGECLVVLQNLTCAVGDVVRLTKTGNKNCSREWGALKVDYETNIGSRTRSRQCNLESEAKRARTNLDNAPSTASSSLLSSASEEDSVKVEIGGTGQMVFLQEKSESSKCRESPLDACAHLSDSLATPPGPLVSKRRKNRRYHGPNPRLRKYFGSYKHFDKSPRSLLRFRAEGAREDRLFKNPNPELMPKPSNRYVALTAAQKRMQCKKDHRGAWVNAGHVDLRKHAMLNCLSGKFYEIKKEYDEMQKSLGVGDGDGGEEEAVPLTLDQGKT